MDSAAFGFLSAGIGAGIAVLGAGIGIGRLAAAAMEGTARQPTATADIRTGMIISAALIEGATLFAIVGCLLLALKTGGPAGVAAAPGAPELPAPAAAR